jgi:hypothetical protein
MRAKGFFFFFFFNKNTYTVNKMKSHTPDITHTFSFLQTGQYQPLLSNIDTNRHHSINHAHLDNCLWNRECNSTSSYLVVQICYWPNANCSLVLSSVTKITFISINWIEPFTEDPNKTNLHHTFFYTPKCQSQYLYFGMANKNKKTWRSP